MGDPSEFCNSMTILPSGVCSLVTPAATFLACHGSAAEIRLFTARQSLRITRNLRDQWALRTYRSPAADLRVAPGDGEHRFEPGRWLALASAVHDADDHQVRLREDGELRAEC